MAHSNSQPGWSNLRLDCAAIPERTWKPSALRECLWVPAIQFKSCHERLLVMKSCLSEVLVLMVATTLLKKEHHKYTEL